MKEALLQKIEEKRKKIERMNNFEKYMHFLDDCELVEMYEVIHNEEKQLKALIELFNEKFGQEKELISQ